ncbi:hypothetical protein FH972_025971 [Carpinus fangiana]|uniref:Calcineurin-like phosphoesterase domain-containing protein n=1 Tax=Carpinus fangiana TaxID=176857 RepID=A0A5N6L2T8_9ROSI|nr:hypothetical protein FH972_025971 [Carpinus fangiana]
MARSDTMGQPVAGPCNYLQIGRGSIAGAAQLAAVGAFILVSVLFLDNQYRVLPSAIHNHLPAHHDGLVITDITVKTCSKLNPFSTCKLDPDTWHRIDKDLYLGQGWTSSAYLHVKRQKEEDLGPEDHVILDVRVGRLDPSTSAKNAGNQKWEPRPAGLWLVRSSKRHESDSDSAITAVDVLFGPDAVEPRPGWRIRDTPLLLESDQTSESTSAFEAHITVRSGALHRVEKPIPRIRKDGRFKIMQLADLHLSTGFGACRDAEPAGHNGGRCEADPRTLNFVERLLDDEQPDLVVLSGDQVNGDTAPDVPSAIYKIASLLTKRPHPIPWAAIFGNHDDEGKPGLSRASQMDVMRSLPYSLAEPGPDNVDGVGNYYVEVLAPGQSQHSALTLYMLDSHGYSPDERQFRGYDWIKDSQIKWFKDTAASLKRAHAKYTKIHLALAFIHIPLPELRDPGNPVVGSWRETVTAPGFNSGFKDALVDARVLALGCGHDHVNDYCMLQQREQHPELWMCYGGGAGFGGYAGYGGYHRRVRVFEVDTNEASVRTWKRLEYGDTAARVDEQVIITGGHVVAPDR